MKQITGISKFLSLGFLVAALVLPAGMNQKAMANPCIKANDRIIVPDPEMGGCIEDDYSISVVRFFNWI